MSYLSVTDSYASSNAQPSRRSQLRVFLAVLFFLDALVLAGVFGLAYVIRFKSQFPFFEDAVSQGMHLWLALGLLPVWLALFALFGLYDSHYLFGSTQEYKKVFEACSVAFTLVVVGTFVVPAVRVSRGWIVIAWSAAIILGTLHRFLLRRVAYYLRRKGWLTARALIVGTDPEARAVAQQIASAPHSGMTIVGFVGEEFSSADGTPRPLLGSIAALPRLVPELQIEEVIISTTAVPREQMLSIFHTFGNSDDVQLRFAPGLFEIYTTRVQVKEIGSVPLMSMRKARLDGIESVVKGVIDYTLALTALFLLMPFLVIVAALVKLDSPGPILYRRRVVGRGGRTFDALKFRTMRVEGDAILKERPDLRDELATNHKLKDDPRVTRVGRFLRKYSIDELPQLMNVLRGQMSLVGPRMITPAELEQYGKWRLNLCTLKPGITGLWQISGRSDVSYAERVRLDMYYIRNYTSWFDLYILWRTIGVVLRGRGAY